MKIIYFGNGPRGLRCFEELLNAKEEIVAVVGHHDTSSAIIDLAHKKGIPIFQPVKVNKPEFVQRIKAFDAQLFILAGYNQILKPSLLNTPEIGCINLHGGKLPDYRGVAPINWQIINGETMGGCCVLWVDEGIDTGDIIDQQYYDIGIEDTSADIICKQLKLFPPMLLKAVKDIRNKVTYAKPQNKFEGTYYTRRFPRDGLVDWKNMTAFQVYNLIRALADPYPNAFTYYHGKKIYLRKAQLMPEAIKGTPGRIALKHEDGLVVIAKDQGLLITEIALNHAHRLDPKKYLKAYDDFS